VSINRDSKARKWVVRIDGVARGPITSDKMKDFIGKKKINPSDLCFELAQDGRTPLSGWEAVSSVLSKGEDIASSRAAQVENPSPVASTHPRVLIAEDSPEIAQILKTILKAYHYEVNHFSNGAVAWQELQSDLHYDLIITDILMPEMTGFELLARLKEQGRTTPILVLTSKGAETDILKALQYGAADYIQKPFSPSAVLSRIEKLLVKKAA